MHKLSDKLMQLDSDPELFALLLTMPVPRDDPEEKDTGITVEDILGPKIGSKQSLRGDVDTLERLGLVPRNSDFSLLSYVFLF